MPRNIIRIAYNVHDIQHCQCKKECHSILLPCMFVDILTMYIVHTAYKFEIPSRRSFSHKSFSKN